MDLLEYQAKEIFAQVGIPILPSQPIHEPGGLKRLNIPYPIVLKSQVRTGGRGKAGGVRFVANTIDAIAAAHAIFHLPIAGEYPEVILAEARYNPQQEIFLAILLDYHLQRPVLLGASQGGMDVDSLLETMQKVVIEERFSPYLCRQLAVSMGLRGSLIESISQILEKMYSLFVSKDLDIIEINPLGINEAGEVMALDGKISVNDAALARHLDLLALTPPQLQSPWSIIDQTGQIAVISNGQGLMSTVWDALASKGAKLAAWLILEERLELEQLNEQIEGGLQQFQLLPDLKVIIVDIISYPDFGQKAIESISNYYRSYSQLSPGRGSGERTIRATRQERQTLEPRSFLNPTPPQIIFRVLADSKAIDLSQSLTDVNFHWLESLEEVITEAIKLA
ncbi:MAG: succinyl-CoA synthetase subunit beta [Microcystis viridis Mv_BB_P_19951000_S69]|uniref:Succinyl-CoA synthetase subunit beta n=1 Tax=Microcystis viridis Mv_BB_P_19951000_S68D TaxID=2486270 RepID=A0A552HIU7_MICVR|nr:ATP-grasp domain-containing protein [Microcystis aeruginosa]TRU71139.1 MAG: succinyl-CoA synthetase subunit beta [Microcystis viridis Mv_BB_P_19951000_S68D]TRU74578.1 MAG: succinyl-CoA synthetase subunit beta [Microcystis viridis Mv_BB_P_19951000_S68]TRU74857.1 MAG: succinyl-CoA synthetase subunit beta [Microcystis viridis Mv_BB_P_19951000_S69]TRU89465.1 MAG: succinyl-CoA synthetase subunit beta [Microcystis viridis Mv_BB_P_19951000_S69D]MDB9421315.1 acetate--CoA ligase family protein [Micr